MVGPNVGKLPSLLLIAVDERFDGREREFARGILITVGDNGPQCQRIRLLAFHGMDTCDCRPDRVIQRGHATRAVILVGKG